MGGKYLDNLDKRELILAKALEVFALKDYQPTTIGEIAIKAGVGRSTIRHYFQTKEILYLELLKNAAEARARTLAENIPRDEDLRVKLGKMITSLLRFAKNQPNYFKILTARIYSDKVDFVRQVEQIKNEHQHEVADLIQEGIRQHKFWESNPEITAVYICKLIEGALEIFQSEANYSVDQIVLSMLHLIWNGLVKR